MNYFIKDGYTERLNNDPSDERGRTDECQDDVYRVALDLMNAHDLNSVMDVGTGGGFKLLKYFADRETLGIDLPLAVEWLKIQYPQKKWEAVPLSGTITGVDLIIASDIIEHLVDPDELLGFIERSAPRFAVISTPNRDNMPHSWDGPPRNSAHVREWSSAEFAMYIGSRFEILDHIYPHADCRDLSTMWVIVRVR